MRSRLSLQERLVVLVLAAVLPLAAMSVWFAIREAEAASELALSQLRFTASAIAAQQDRSIESAQHLLMALSAVPELRAPQRAVCEKFFERLRAQYTIYANVGLVDTTGRMICHAQGRVGDFDASDRDYFQGALRGRFTMGAAVTGRVSARWVLPFGYPVTDEGRVTGVVFATVDLVNASRALAAMDLPAGARVMIADRAGRVLMEYPRTESLPDGRKLATPEWLEAAAGMAPRIGETEAFDALRLYAIAPTRFPGVPGVATIVSLDRAAATGPFYRRLERLAAAMVACLVLGVAAAWWIGGRIVVKPAKQILSAVRRLEQGSLDARVPLQAGKPRGEFARIAAAFNLMAGSLQLRQRDLEAELGRSRSAYAVLDTVLNSMQEGLIAVDRGGRVLLHNRAAAEVFPLAEPVPPPQEWPQAFGLYVPGTAQRLEADDMPFARAVRGEPGEMAVLVRNAQVRHGRLLRCTYGPMASADGPAGGLVVFTDVTELEQAEADLVLLRNAIARLNDIVLITEAQPIEAPNGPRIVFVNEAFERLTGFSDREAIGNTPRMLQGPGTDRAALDRIRAALEAGQPVREELLNYTKEGRPIWLEVDIVPLADERGRYTHLISVQRDITARKQFEQALLASERELQDYNEMLQRTAEAAQAITRHRTLEDTLHEVMQQARSVIGTREASLSLEPPAAAAARTAAGVLVVPLVGSHGEAVGRLRLAQPLKGDFTERDEYVAIELAQLATTAIENARLFEQIRELNAGLESRIAERTAELARQEKRYRALAEQAPEIVWNVDAAGGVSYFNRAWYELVGGQPPQWLGEGWLARIHPDDLAEMRERWRQSRRTLEPYFGTRRVLARDGSWHTTAYHGAPVLDEHGRLEFWVGIDSDITELKAIEQALRDSNQELEAFSYSVSHDLRAPLGAIGGFSQALAAKLQGLEDEKARHYLARIQAGAKKMEELIDALLGLSRVARAPLSHEAVDLSLLARETLEGLQMQQPLRQVLVSVQDGQAAQGDPRLLRVLLENLLGNAWKFTSARADAVIEFGRDATSGAFYVRDNGVGFDMAHADKLFTAFQRLHTEAEFPGTGIGLATVRRIVARHQGRVWVQSQPGAGTTFYFTLHG